VTYHFRET